MARLPCWVQLRVLLRAARDPSTAVAARAELQLRRWLAVRRYVLPTAEESEALRAELERSAARPALREEVQHRLRLAEAARR